MTVRTVYESVLTEVNKVLAPCFLLADFNYYLNKAVSLYVNKRYNQYDTSLQVTDDLRVLKATAALPVTVSVNKDIQEVLGDTYLVIIPSDYLHILGCTCVFDVLENDKCLKLGLTIRRGARKVTADLWPHLNENYYLRPSFKQPYWCINNINTREDNPTNPYNLDTNLGTDILGVSLSTSKYGIPIIKTIGGLPKTVKINNKDIDSRDKIGLIRYGNTSTVRLEIRCGTVPSKYRLSKVGIDYLKTPLYLELTTELLDLVNDTSLIMEFPDYVNQEIINELNYLFLENFGDSRLQTNIPVTLSIATTQQLTQQ